MRRIPKLNTNEIDRFRKHIKYRPIVGCWEADLAVNSSGYPNIGIQGKLYRMSRISYFLYYGEDPGDLFVCHRCDNPKCVKPLHLFLGTAKDNSRDAAKKGRMASGEQHGMNKKPHRRTVGERNGMAKLTKDDVKKIRKEYIPGKVSQKEIANRYGVSRPAISMIMNGGRWKEAH